jgi:hypothetical protein
LLAERGDRRQRGTRVTVRVPDAPKQSMLEYIRATCPRVEFPIVVRDHGHDVTIRAEAAEDFVAASADPLNDSVSYTVRSFPFSEDGVSGELYVLCRLKDGRETWGVSDYLAEHLSNRAPIGHIPTAPPALVCYNGIAIWSAGRGMGQASHYRVDCRTPALVPTLSRRQLRSAFEWTAHESPLDELLKRQWEIRLLEHSESATRDMEPDQAWRYKQQLADRFKLKELWRRVDGMIPLHESGELRAQSLRDVMKHPRVWFVAQRGWRSTELPDAELAGLDAPVLVAPEAHAMCDTHQEEIFADRHVEEVKNFGAWTAVKWAVEGKSRLAVDTGGVLIYGGHAVSFPDAMNERFAFWMPATRLYYGWVFINKNHPLGAWCLEMWSRCWIADDQPLSRKAADRLWLSVRAIYGTSRETATLVSEFNAFLDDWNRRPSVPSHLRPPDIRLAEPDLG